MIPMVLPGNSPVRVLVDVSPSLLAETITRLLRRPDVVICLDPAAENGDSGPVEIAITDHRRIASTGADLVLRIPAEPRSVGTARPEDTDALSGNVIDLTDLADLVRLVGDFADGVRPMRSRPPA